MTPDPRPDRFAGLSREEVEHRIARRALSSDLSGVTLEKVARDMGIIPPRDTSEDPGKPFGVEDELIPSFLWPDDDDPRHPTIQDVQEKMQRRLEGFCTAGFPYVCEGEKETRDDGSVYCSCGLSAAPSEGG